MVQPEKKVNLKFADRYSSTVVSVKYYFKSVHNYASRLLNFLNLFLKFIGLSVELFKNCYNKGGHLKIYKYAVLFF